MNQTPTIKKNTRVELYDWIRVIATIFVVIGHAAYLKIVTANGGINYILPSQLSPTYNGFLLSSLGFWLYGYTHFTCHYFSFYLVLF